MNRKELVEEISIRMRTLRKAFRYSRKVMANKLGASESSIYKTEKGKNSPDLWSYYGLAKTLNVSLDWIIAGKGEMMYKEPPAKVEPEPVESVAEPAPGEIALRTDISELLEHMDRIPLLRYKVLTMFHEFKDEKKEMVSEAMKEAKK